MYLCDQKWDLAEWGAADATVGNAKPPPLALPEPEKGIKDIDKLFYTTPGKIRTPRLYLLALILVQDQSLKFLTLLRRKGVIEICHLGSDKYYSSLFSEAKTPTEAFLDSLPPMQFQRTWGGGGGPGSLPPAIMDEPEAVYEWLLDPAMALARHRSAGHFWHSESFSWGGASFYYRPGSVTEGVDSKGKKRKQTVKPSYEVVCPRMAHKILHSEGGSVTTCQNTKSWKTGDSEAKAIVVKQLKCWVAQCMHHAGKKDHESVPLVKPEELPSDADVEALKLESDRELTDEDIARPQMQKNEQESKKRNKTRQKSAAKQKTAPKPEAPKPDASVPGAAKAKSAKKGPAKASSCSGSSYILRVLVDS